MPKRQALRELDDCPKNHYIMYNFYATWKCLRRDVLNGDEKLVFHSLRHTFATRQANEFRLNHTLIPKIMGHRSLVTTSKYVKLMPEVQQSVCDAM
jgi:integrase